MGVNCCIQYVRTDLASQGHVEVDRSHRHFLDGRKRGRDFLASALGLRLGCFKHEGPIRVLVRKNIMADKNLSTYAHNVKVVAVGGTVTLNGVVRSAEEKTKLSAIAVQVAGKDRVVDELKIAPPKS